MSLGSRVSNLKSPSLSVMDDLEIAVAAARAGGAIVRDGFAQSVTPEYKRQFDPVTATDHSSEALSLIHNTDPTRS